MKAGDTLERDVIRSSLTSKFCITFQRLRKGKSLFLTGDPYNGREVQEAKIKHDSASLTNKYDFSNVTSCQLGSYSHDLDLNFFTNKAFS